ncbi:hypothetical protein BJ944DRAFT_226829 [Cunninghamella echinulata]|nr:hypothetical protein BJ944DRAFT_226829 [Cunninghamella echinulata]
MYFDSSTNTIKQQQQDGCTLPPIPQNLIQPLRDAIPKIDQALLNSVPKEAIPLCQQLFSACNNNTKSKTTPTTNSNNNNNRINMSLPRAKTSMNIKSYSQYSPTFETNSLHPLQQESTMEKKQCRKSQSASKLSSWFSFSLPKKKNSTTTITPMVHYKKKSAQGGNISEITVTGEGEIYDTKKVRSKSNIDLSHMDHITLSSPPISSPSLRRLSKSSQKMINQSHRRTFSMMLSKLGIRVGRLKENEDSHQQQHSHHSRPISAPLILSTINNSNNNVSSTLSSSPSIYLNNHRNAYTNNRKESTDHDQHQQQQNDKKGLKEKIYENDIESLNTVDSHKISQHHPWKVETNLVPPPAPYSTAFDLPQLMNELPELPLSSSISSSYSSSSSLASIYSSSDSISVQDQILFYHSQFCNEDGDNQEQGDNNDRPNQIINHNNKNEENKRKMKKEKKKNDNLNSPSVLTNRTVVKMSKTETNLKSEMSVPFIKMGLGRKSIDVDDHVQYHRSNSIASFDLQWQEKFHTHQQPRERVAITLKSVSLALYEFIQHNHLHQKFNSDTSYVAHPLLESGKDTQELFTAIPLTQWRDIFDQLAYVFENGELSAEHAIITMIYIERMLKNSKQDLCEVNWRLIILAGLIVSIKVWDDCAVYNIDFVQIFPELDIMHINLIERRFLEHIGWDISVGCSLFATFLFIFFFPIILFH